MGCDIHLYIEVKVNGKRKCYGHRRHALGVLVR